MTQERVFPDAVVVVKIDWQEDMPSLIPGTLAAYLLALQGMTFADPIIHVLD